MSPEINDKIGNAIIINKTKEQLPEIIRIDYIKQYIGEQMN